MATMGSGYEVDSRYGVAQGRSEVGLGTRGSTRTKASQAATRHCSQSRRVFWESNAADVLQVSLSVELKADSSGELFLTPVSDSAIPGRVWLND